MQTLNQHNQFLKESVTGAIYLINPRVMKTKLFNEIVEKAKLKPNGVFSHKKTLYGVKDKRPVLFCDYFGKVLQNSYGFLADIGDMSKLYSYDRKKELARLLGSL